VRRTPSAGRILLLGCPIVLLLAATGGPRAEETEFDPLNFAFAAYMGSGIYSTGAGEVYLFRIPVGFTILSPEGRPVGLRLRLRTTLGFYNFDLDDLINLGIPDKVGTVSVLGGVELPIPIRENWVLGPFVDFGPAWDSESETWSWVVGAGARSRATFPWKGSRFVLWNELVAAANFGAEEVERDDFGKFMADLEYPQPLRWTIGGRPTAISPFIKAELFFNELIIKPVEGEPLEVRDRYEVGVKFGWAERGRVWRIPVPRVGLGYRFGSGVTSIRIIISGRY
jgi:hypothetical protein